VRKFKELDECSNDMNGFMVAFTNGSIKMFKCNNDHTGGTFIKVTNDVGNTILIIKYDGDMITPNREFLMIDELIGYINSLVEKCIVIDENKKAVALERNNKSNEKVYEFLRSV
jgi:hypothetical protein